jgi:hypothetical protein
MGLIRYLVDRLREPAWTIHGEFALVLADSSTDLVVFGRPTEFRPVVDDD